MMIVVVLLIDWFIQHVCDDSVEQYESHRDVSRGPCGRVCGGDQVVGGDNHWSHLGGVRG